MKSSLALVHFTYYKESKTCASLRAWSRGSLWGAIRCLDPSHSWLCVSVFGATTAETSRDRQRKTSGEWCPGGGHRHQELAHGLVFTFSSYFFLSEQMSFYRNFRFFPSGVPGRAKPVFLRTHLSQTTAVDISTGKFPFLNKGAGAKQNYREDKI